MFLATDGKTRTWQKEAKPCRFEVSGKESKSTASDQLWNHTLNNQQVMFVAVVTVLNIIYIYDCD